MVLCLLVLLLLTGAVALILPVPREYILIQEEKTWSDAQAYCRATYIDLATVESNNDMIKLQNEAKRKQFLSSGWIGLYTNINSWHWSFGNESLGSFSSWANTEPNNILADEQCAAILNMLWIDAPCTWRLYFVCVDDSTSGTDSYILIDQALTWFEAQSYCRQKHTDLASARDATENSIVGKKNLFSKTWFGLSRDPWKWSDQTPMSIMQWSPGDSYDYLKNKSCGCFSGTLGDAAQCSDMMPFFCYLFPKQQQIVRVKVKSSEDVNDPKIMTAVLAKIKQKLGDHGMAENITVDWRKQPDGVVFYKEKDNNTAILNITRGSCDL